MSDWLYQPLIAVIQQDTGAAEVLPTGVASAVAYGSPTLSVNLVPSGIATAAGYGSPGVKPGVSPAGIASVSAVGTPAAQPTIAPTGVASSAAFGTPGVAASLAPTGVASAAVYGSPTVSTVASVLPTGVASAAAYGSPTALPVVAPTGVATGAAYGSPEAWGIKRTGSIVEIDSTANSGSQAITVPSDAELMMVFVSGYPVGGATGWYTSGTLTIDGQSMDGSVAADGNTNYLYGALWYKLAPPTGSKTLAWDWTGTALAAAGTCLVVAFYKGCATSSVVRDSYGGQEGTSPHATDAMTTQAGDMAVAWVAQYLDAGNTTTVAWTNATKVADYHASTSGGYNRTMASLSEAWPTGSSVTITATLSYSSDGGIVGIVLKPKLDTAASILPTGVASAAAYGSPALSASVAPTGVASVAAFGTPSIGATLAATGIASASAYGSPTVKRYGAVTLVAKAKKSGGSGAQTTPAVDTTGANFLLVALVTYTSPTMSNLSDSKGNTWQILTTYGTGNFYVTLAYVYNPTVGSSHTVTFNQAIWPLIFFYAFSGMSTSSSVYDASTGDVDGTPGSITPKQANELLVTALADSTTTSDYVVDAEWDEEDQTIYSSGVNPGGAVAFINPYLPTTSQDATWTGGTPEASVIAAFRRAVMELTATGVGSAAAYGTPTVETGANLLPTGIASAAAYGAPSISTTVAPSGVASSAAYGTPTVAGTGVIVPTGIASAAAYGTPSVKWNLNPSGISSVAAFGTPSVGPRLGPTGIASGAAYGSPTFRLTVAPSGISSAAAFGQPSATVTVAPTGISSAAVFGVPLVAPLGSHLISPTGVTSAFAAGLAWVGIPGTGYMRIVIGARYPRVEAQSRCPNVASTSRCPAVDAESRAPAVAAAGRAVSVEAE